MTRRNEWEIFFDRYAPKCMNEAFTKNTVKEIEGHYGFRIYQTWEGIMFPYLSCLVPKLV